MRVLAVPTKARKLFGLAFVAAVQTAALIEPGHGPSNDPAMAIQAVERFDASTGVEEQAHTLASGLSLKQLMQLIEELHSYV